MLGVGPACGSCKSDSVAGLNVTVVDGATQQRICDASVTATDGDYTETLKDYGGTCRYTGAWDRAGTYAITATKSGYGTASLQGVVVKVDDCGHADSQMRTIVMTPE
jgi:hypothetical protein